MFASIIRPEIERLGVKTADRTAAPVLTFDRTVPMCRAGVEPTMPLGCIQDEPIQAVVAELRPGRGVSFKGLLNTAARRELTRAFRERNRESQRSSGDRIGGLVVVSPNDYQRELESRRTGTVRFSAPAYSGEGHALVYGSYVCGGLCGYGWLFLLERSGDSWRVVSTELVWIS